MSCFLVPMMQALATSAYRRHNISSIENPGSGVFKHNVPTLEKMLWGGTLMLVADHILSGELTWRFPFFTALNQTDGIYAILEEMLTVGLPLSLTITAAWAIHTAVRQFRMRRA